jgi:hypothetical protein
MPIISVVMPANAESLSNMLDSIASMDFIPVDQINGYLLSFANSATD